jgi:hypothetical protein
MTAPRRSPSPNRRDPTRRPRSFFPRHSRPPRRRRASPRAASERHKVLFRSGNKTCAAWHHPGTTGACVLMAGHDHACADAARRRPAAARNALRYQTALGFVRLSTRGVRHAVGGQRSPRAPPCGSASSVPPLRRARGARAVSAAGRRLRRRPLRAPRPRGPRSPRRALRGGRPPARRALRAIHEQPRARCRSRAVVPATPPARSLSAEDGPGITNARRGSNNNTVVAFYERAINNFTAASERIGPRYVQHNPRIADGIQGLRTSSPTSTRPTRRCAQRSRRSSPRTTCSSPTSTAYECPASAAQPSWTSSSSRTRTSSNAGTSCSRSQKKPKIHTGCSKVSREAMGPSHRLPG